MPSFGGQMSCRRVARICAQVEPSRTHGLQQVVHGRNFSTNTKFKAWVVDSEKGKLKDRSIKEFDDVRNLPRQDPEANVTVRVLYSGLNYKDAMIIKGQHGLCSGFPIVPGIDFAGVVEQSDSELWNPGDEVVLTGNKIGQHFDGGWAERCRVQAEWLVPKPQKFSLEECMVIGTAGFTAAQMVSYMTQWGGMNVFTGGKVLVTGAGGGVGGMAVAILANIGFKVVASTGRAEELDSYLRGLGASEVIGRLEDVGKNRALQPQMWEHVVDTVGGSTLSTALAQTKYNGCVTTVGVAGGAALDTTAYPFILRGIWLMGIDSTLPWNVKGYDDNPKTWRSNRQTRLYMWREMLQTFLNETDLRTLHMATIALDDVPSWSERLMSGEVRGRVVVRT